MADDSGSGPTYEAPYRGLRVLDFGQGIASPYCGALLAANGADVIKVEPPEGDWSRRLGTTYGRHTAISAVFNRGKRSLCLDLKDPKGLDIAQQLAGRATSLSRDFGPASRHGSDLATRRSAATIRG
jgi:crotonobetainyl-CoA:carnitine CoA-transferase CaiB-like acyl-CoA transferase